ncbi:tetratricopeptide repeat protein [Microvirga calopogonii]|uniref:tetratricopeptide repeat protein n=1 Tax=Microvirga calopogonii TaxID=2078013 RepID=UPI003CCB0BC5
MEHDETGTLRKLVSHREIMDRLIAEHGGRIANTAGDSVLAEFPSAVDAVQCAMEVQKALGHLNEGAPPEKALRFRIGIHVGDVVIRGSDLLGDGVNVAARLEGLADPGGLCISGDAHRQVRKALPLPFTDLGSQQVKNIDEPIQVFAMRFDESSSARTEAKALSPVRTLPLPDKPSIAVLPFVNMSPSPDAEFFADGITEDIITALARLKWLFVIARNSTFTYKGKAVDVRQVARDLGVRYVVEGCVRASGQRIRITGQLIDAETGHHIWAERYDRPLNDIFAVQDEITESVVATIEPHLYAEESFRATLQPPESIAVWGLVIRALTLINKADRSENQQAQLLLNRAIESEPTYARAHAVLSWAKWWEALNQWTPDASAVSAVYEGAAEVAGHALALDPDEPWARMTLGLTLSRSGHHDQALEQIQTALDAHPNWALGRAMCGFALVRAGRFDDAISETGHALRMSPLDTFAGIYTVFHALALMSARRFSEALIYFRKTVQSHPDFLGQYGALISCCGHLGLLDEAQMYLRRRNNLTSTPYSVSQTRREMSRFAHVDVFVEGLSKAGVPE